MAHGLTLEGLAGGPRPVRHGGAPANFAQRVGCEGREEQARQGQASGGVRQAARAASMSRPRPLGASCGA